jgi:hypothetical protein
MTFPPGEVVETEASPGEYDEPQEQEALEKFSDEAFAAES